jgi:uncharacterized protein involved in exopolysaccharide biosynthesis
MSKYVEILFRHRLRFVALFVAFPMVVGTAVILLFPHDAASASLWVDNPTYLEVSPSANGWNQYLTPSQNTIDALNQLMGTHAFYKTLADRLDAESTFSSASERSSVLSTFGADFKATASGSHLVVMNYVCPRPAVCVGVLNNTIEIYRDWLAARQQSQAKVALDFYTGQLSGAKSKLQNDETAFANYLTAHPSARVTDTAINPELDSLYRTVTSDRSAVNSLQSKLDALQLTDAAAVQINNTVLNVIDAPRITTSRLGALPRKQLAIAEAICAAVAIGVLAVMAWSDRTVRDPKEIQSRLQIPVVATIPDLSSVKAAAGRG